MRPASFVRHGVGLLVALVAVVGSGAAHAQPVDPASATELFRQGREALAAKDYATACPKLEASVALDSRVGNLISLAQCEEATGRLAAARAHWQRAADFAHGQGDKREADAAAGLAALDPRVPRLTVRVAADAPAAMNVTRDGVEIVAGAYDVPLPVEVGAHVIVALAAGYEPSRVTVDLAEGQATEVVVHPGAKLPVENPVVPPRATAEEHPSRVGPLALGVTGAATLLVGGVFGVVAVVTNNQADGLCPSHLACPSSAISKGSTSNTEAWVANVAVPAGVVVVAGATIWWLVNGRSKAGQAQPSALPLAPRATLSARGVAFVW